MVWKHFLAGALFAPVLLTAAAVGIEPGSDRIEVTIGGQPFTTYYFTAEVAKAYLMPLRTTSGIVLTRGFPVGNQVSEADRKSPSFEPHQRPLYFGHGDISGVDFWTEEVFNGLLSGAAARAQAPPAARRAYGRMALVKIEDAKGGPDAGAIRARFHLEDPARRILAEETQAFTFRGGDDSRTIDCEFVIQAGLNPVVFGDTKEGTFGIRLRQELSAPHDHMINSLGAQGEPAIWGKPADWVAYSGTIDGKPVGIAVFDSPTSFRHPTTWHARAYGLFAANPFGAREFTNDPNRDASWTLPEGKSLAFRYRVVIYDGARTPAQLGEMYRQYAAGK
jgi:hypothetical protein